MRETLLFRIYDRPSANGVTDYVFEIAVPGRYEKHIVGASQVELGMKLIDTFDELFSLLGIPENVQRVLTDLGENMQTNAPYIGSDGAPIPISGFTATAKLSVEAEVYRDGVAVPASEDAARQAAAEIAEKQT